MVHAWRSRLHMRGGHFLILAICFLLMSCSKEEQATPGLPISADFPGKFVFSKDADPENPVRDELYILDHQGTRQITSTCNDPGCYKFAPAWMDAGRKIVWLNNSPDSLDGILMIEPGGHIVKVLPGNPSTFFSSMSISQDERLMAVIGTDGIVIYNMGSSFSPVFVERIASQQIGSIEWSPDKAKIACSSLVWENWNLIGTQFTVFSVDPPQPIFISGLHTYPLVAEFCSWSQLNTLVFEINGDIYTCLPDGTDRQEVTQTSAYLELDPEWSPETDEIIYIKRAKDSIGIPDRILRFSPSLGVETEIFQSSEVSEINNLTWSPDGAYIVFSSGYFNKKPGPQTGMYIIHKDGTDLKRISGEVFKVFDWYTE